MRIPPADIFLKSQIITFRKNRLKIVFLSYRGSL